MESFQYKDKKFFRILCLRDYYGSDTKRVLQRSAKDSLNFVQRLDLEKKLDVHKGCVNSIQFNANGTRILSGSDDQKLVITDWVTEQVLVKYTTNHRSNIFSAKFLDDDSKLVSCAGDGTVIYTDLEQQNLKLETGSSSTLVGGKHHRIIQDSNINFYNCHNGTAYEILTIDSNSFSSCGEDGTVRFFDIRLNSRCIKANCHENILILTPLNAITTMTLSNNSNYICCGCSDSNIRMFDRRYLKLVEFPTAAPTGKIFNAVDQQTMPVKIFNPGLTNNRITSVVYNRSNNNELLVSYSSNYLYLLDVTKDGILPIEPIKLTKGGRRKNSPKVMKKLRLRGDWSDTGPEARPQDELAAQASRPQLQSGLMQRMQGLLSRILSDRVSIENDSDNFASVAESLSVLFQEAPNADVAGPSNLAANPTPEETNDSTTSSSDEEDSTLKNLLEDVEEYQRNCDFVLQKYVGHRNARTQIKEANFWGDNFILSGSDCGHVFIWDKTSGEVVMVLTADNHVVNCVQPHPTLPILATSGIDYNIKLWAPKDDSNRGFDENFANDLMNRNAKMLEETRDTITVPARFLIRIISVLHQLQSRNRDQDQPASNENENSDN